jgi:hypothetical protein
MVQIMNVVLPPGVVNVVTGDGELGTADGHSSGRQQGGIHL